MPDQVAGLPIELAHLSWLVGEWEGLGTGQYPGIDDFRFAQRVSVTCDGRPFLAYQSKSWLLDDDGETVRPLARESGYWRPRPDNGVELLLSHPTGYSEVWHGTVTIKALETAKVTGAQMELRTDMVARTETAKEYTSGERLYGLVRGELLWTFDMAAVGHPMSNHIAARLRPLDDAGDSVDAAAGAAGGGSAAEVDAGSADDRATSG